MKKELKEYLKGLIDRTITENEDEIRKLGGENLILMEYKNPFINSYKITLGHFPIRNILHKE